MNSIFYVFKRYIRARGIPIYLSVPLGMLAVGLARYAILLPGLYQQFLNQRSPTWSNAFLLEGVAGLVKTLTFLTGTATLVLLAGMVIGFVRKPWSLKILRACYQTCYLLGLVYFYAVMCVTDIIFAKDLKIGGVSPNAGIVFQLRLDYLWPALAVLAVIGVAHLCSWRRVALDWYMGFHKEEPAPGDIIIENLRMHGADPQFRKSIIYSLMAHFMIIIVIPCLLTLRGCVTPYGVPEGSGSASLGNNTVVGLVKIVKPKRKAARRFILNPNSAIAWKQPDIDDSDLSKDIDKDSEETYAADPSSAHQEGGGGGGKLGAGGGKRGGWPGGMKNAIVRFIRLEYKGEGWDHGMDQSLRADVNFLQAFGKDTGFKVATHAESHPIRLLDDYPKGYAPPFVYMTGIGSINVSPKDLEILRKYLMDGGMLFADCGSPTWDRNFRAFVQALFPGEPLLVVADDDLIYQRPYTFQNGAPPLWHHGGFKALGIKRGNRWVVYYHPGDMKNAWATGHSGMNSSLTRQAYNLGVNIVYHAFTHYMEATRKYRKQ